MTVTLVIEGEDAEYLADAIDLSPYGSRLQSEAPLAQGRPVGSLCYPNPLCSLKRA